MVTVSRAIFPLLFADDSNVFINGNDIDTLISNMNTELQKLLVWLQCNRLSLNIDKTHFMLFRSKNKMIKRPLIPLKINNQFIEEVHQTKFLGVIIDDQLTWSQHITHVKNKVAKGIGIITKVKNFVNGTTLKTLYYSFVYPYINYCIVAWGSTYNKYINGILLLQKKIIRIICKTAYLEHTDPLFKKLNILPVKKVYVYNVAQFMYKWNNGLLPDIFDTMFTYNCKYHQYNTRTASQLSIPSYSLNVRGNTISKNGVKVWNLVMSNNYHNIKSYDSYKKTLKSFLNTNNFDLFQ
jgi:hypothetical protein